MEQQLPKSPVHTTALAFAIISINCFRPIMLPGRGTMPARRLIIGSLFHI